MKKIYILMPVFLSLVIISASSGVAEIQNQDRTGSPDGANVCSQCHSSSAFSPTAGLVITDDSGNLVTTYEPGVTYMVSLGVTELSGTASEYGFQMTALDGQNNNAGAFVNLGSQVQAGVVDNATVSNRNVIEHSTPAAVGVWQSEWTAPATPVGDVTFYFSTITANGNGQTSGDTYTGGTVVLAASAGDGIAELEELDITMTQSEEGVRFNSPISTVLSSVDAYSVTGRLVFSAENFNTSDVITKADLPSGISIIVVNDGSSSKTFKTLQN